MGTLYIVATPIGNLKDITLRALEVLKGVDIIFAEDTRVTKKLLLHYEIYTSIKRYDEYSNSGVYKEVQDRLEQGQLVALVTDAGTPGIADPGSKLVAFIQKELPEAKIIPIPGPTALISTLSVSGINANQFTFLGYPPHKKGRQTFFKKLSEITIKPIMLYESPHRLEKTLQSFIDVFGNEKEIVVARELTKVHEEIWRGPVQNAKTHFQGERKRGEFAILIL